MMPENTIHTKKKYHNSKRNKKQSIMKGGSSRDQDEALNQAKQEAIETLNNENQIIEFLTGEPNTNQAIKTDISIARNVKVINNLMNSFEIDGITEDYTPAAVDSYIQKLLPTGAPTAPKGAPVEPTAPTAPVAPTVPEPPFELVLEEDRRIPLVVSLKKQYEKILAEASKLQRKQEIITKSLEFYGEDPEKSMLDRQKTALGKNIKVIRTGYQKLGLKRTPNAGKNIKHLEDFYIHSNLNTKKELESFFETLLSDDYKKKKNLIEAIMTNNFQNFEREIAETISFLKEEVSSPSPDENIIFQTIKFIITFNLEQINLVLPTSEQQPKNDVEINKTIKTILSNLKHINDSVHFNLPEIHTPEIKDFKETYKEILQLQVFDD